LVAFIGLVLIQIDLSGFFKPISLRGTGSVG
jgi:hypothetical protein